jgi:Tfp pilus assembly protein PilO
MQDNFLKEFWVSAGIVVGSVFIAGGILLWIASDVQAYTERISQSRLLVNQRARSIEVLARLKQNDRDVESYQKLMNQILPTKEELLDFNRKLEDTARVNQVTLNSSFQSGGTTMPGGEQAGSVAFRFDANGSYENLVNFYNEIEKKSPKFLVSVDNLDVQASTEGSGLRFSSQARVFFR